VTSRSLRRLGQHQPATVPRPRPGRRAQAQCGPGRQCPSRHGHESPVRGTRSPADRGSEAGPRSTSGSLSEPEHPAPAAGGGRSGGGVAGTEPDSGPGRAAASDSEPECPQAARDSESVVTRRRTGARRAAVTGQPAGPRRVPANLNLPVSLNLNSRRSDSLSESMPVMTHTAGVRVTVPADHRPIRRLGGLGGPTSPQVSLVLRSFESF
jgi:hypothetical protein